MPELRRGHSADRVHHGAGPDPEDPHTFGRTDRTASARAGSWPAHRVGRSSCRCTTIARSSRPHPTSCPRSTSIASDRRQTRGTEAPGPADWEPVCAEATKTPPQWGAGRSWQRVRAARNARFRCSRARRQPRDRCESAVGRDIPSLSLLIPRPPTHSSSSIAHPAAA